RPVLPPPTFGSKGRRRGVHPTNISSFVGYGRTNPLGRRCRLERMSAEPEECIQWCSHRRPFGPYIYRCVEATRVDRLRRFFRRRTPRRTEPTSARSTVHSRAHRSGLACVV